MSAFLCCNSHLSFLAGYAVANGLTTASAESVAELLYIANMNSLLARYGQTAMNDGVFEFRTGSASRDWVLSVPAIQVVKSAQCFAYQACEFSAWPQTRAYALIEAIRDHALAQTPFATIEAVQRTGAYNNAAWGGPSL